MPHHRITPIRQLYVLHPGQKRFSFRLHRLGQQAIWDDAQERLMCGELTIEPRVEPVPVRLPLPPAPDASSIFKVQKTAGVRSAFAV